MGSPLSTFEECAVLKSIGDESGITSNSRKRSRISVVAGLAGNEDRWCDFDHRWPDTLGRKHPQFHATALGGGDEEVFRMDVARCGRLPWRHQHKRHTRTLAPALCLLTVAFGQQSGRNACAKLLVS